VHGELELVRGDALVVAPRVDPFENPNFETGFSLYRLESRIEETRRFRALWVKCIRLVAPTWLMALDASWMRSAA
jgi:hypothetical protein